MKLLRLVIPMTLLVASAATAQLLDCPGSASRTSDSYHFHVSMYRPDTRGFFDAWGVNQFSSQSACERAREAQMKRNLAVVDYFKKERGENQYEPDRFGTCHADLSTDKANPRFLTDVQRVAQIRGAEDVRQRVRERLLDANVTTDSELYRGVAAPISTPPPQLGGPKLVPLPQAAPAQASYAASDLRATRGIDTSKPTLASVDLPLVDPVAGLTPTVASSAPSASTPAAPAPAAAPVVTAATQPPATPAATETVAPATVAVAAETAAQAKTGPASAEVSTAEDAAESFIAYETQRIQNVLKASSAIADGDVKAKIYEACMQRIQLLSNLRSLIESAGAKSRLAGMTRSVRTEQERLALVAKLFGDDIGKHWAPADATDVILPAQPDVDNDADRVLRDSGSKYTDQQKKRALYVLLARSQPTEDQQLWLTTIVDGFLQ